MVVGICLSFLDIFMIHSTSHRIQLWFSHSPVISLTGNSWPSPATVLWFVCCCGTTSLFTVVWGYMKRSKGFDLTERDQERWDVWQVPLVVLSQHKQLTEIWLQKNDNKTSHVTQGRWQHLKLLNILLDHIRIRICESGDWTKAVKWPVHREVNNELELAIKLHKTVGSCRFRW